MQHIVISKGDKLFICTDHPECEFRSCDRFSLIRHQSTPQACPRRWARSSSLDHDSILSLYESSMDSLYLPNLLSSFPGSPSSCHYDSTMSRLAEIGFFNFLTEEPDTEQSVTTSEQH